MKSSILPSTHLWRAQPSHAGEQPEPPFGELPADLSNDRPRFIVWYRGRWVVKGNTIGSLCDLTEHRHKAKVYNRGNIPYWDAKGGHLVAYTGADAIPIPVGLPSGEKYRIRCPHAQNQYVSEARRDMELAFSFQAEHAQVFNDGWNLYWDIMCARGNPLGLRYLKEPISEPMTEPKRIMEPRAPYFKRLPPAPFLVFIRGRWVCSISEDRSDIQTSGATEQALRFLGAEWSAFWEGRKAEMVPVPRLGRFRVFHKQYGWVTAWCPTSTNYDHSFGRSMVFEADMQDAIMADQPGLDYIPEDSGEPAITGDFFQVHHLYNGWVKALGRGESGGVKVDFTETRAEAYRFSADDKQANNYFDGADFVTKVRPDQASPKTQPKPSIPPTTIHEATRGLMMVGDTFEERKKIAGTGSILDLTAYVAVENGASLSPATWDRARNALETAFVAGQASGRKEGQEALEREQEQSWRHHQTGVEQASVIQQLNKQIETIQRSQCGRHPEDQDAKLGKIVAANLSHTRIEPADVSSLIQLCAYGEIKYKQLYPDHKKDVETACRAAYQLGYQARKRVDLAVGYGAKPREDVLGYLVKRSQHGLNKVIQFSNVDAIRGCRADGVCWMKEPSPHEKEVVQACFRGLEQPAIEIFVFGDSKTWPQPMEDVILTAQQRSKAERGRHLADHVLKDAPQQGAQVIHSLDNLYAYGLTATDEYDRYRVVRAAYALGRSHGKADYAEETLGSRQHIKMIELQYKQEIAKVEFLKDGIQSLSRGSGFAIPGKADDDDKWKTHLAQLVARNESRRNLEEQIELLKAQNSDARSALRYTRNAFVMSIGKTPLCAPDELDKKEAWEEFINKSLQYVRQEAPTTALSELVLAAVQGKSPMQWSGIIDGIMKAKGRKDPVLVQLAAALADGKRLKANHNGVFLSLAPDSGSSNGHATLQIIEPVGQRSDQLSVLLSFFQQPAFWKIQ